MKPTYINSATCINFHVENNDKYPKFKVCDHVWILKYGHIFAKVCIPNWPEEVLWLKKLKTVLDIYNRRP